MESPVGDEIFIDHGKATGGDGFFNAGLTKMGAKQIIIVSFGLQCMAERSPKRIIVG